MKIKIEYDIDHALQVEKGKRYFIMIPVPWSNLEINHFQIIMNAIGVECLILPSEATAIEIGKALRADENLFKILKEEFRKIEGEREAM